MASNRDGGRTSRDGSPATTLRRRLESMDMDELPLDERPQPPSSEVSVSSPPAHSRLLSARQGYEGYNLREGDASSLRRGADDRSSHARAHPASHVRFSEERPGRSSGATRELRLDTDLYTIQSNVELPGVSQSRRPDNMTDAIHEDEPFSQPTGRMDVEGLRDSGSSIAETPISLTRPRRFGGLNENIRSAVTMAEANVTLANYRDWVRRHRDRQRQWARGPTGRVKKATAAWYKKYIIEGLLRRKPLPPSADGRHIPLEPGRSRRKALMDERTGRPYVSNFIRSSRYTIWDFLPKQLFFQFSKLANFYFLLIGLLQLVPGLSTTGKYTTIGPLLAFVAISMAKEGYDDYRRYKLDKVENRSETWVMDPAAIVKDRSRRRLGDLRPSFGKKPRVSGTEMAMSDLRGMRYSNDSNPWSRIQWQALRVGDIIRLERDDSFPTDIVLLHATGPNGVAYIETMALDGETNLKSKQACPLLAEHCGSLASISACDAEIVVEDPNLDLYNFEGRVIVNGETMPLTMSEVVYRGSTLRNTSEAIGLVINTGEECKIRMNASKDVHAKAPKLQAKVNRIVILLVILVIMLSVGLTLGYEEWYATYARFAWYIKSANVPFKEIIIGFIIEFNTLIPLSLYVSLEIIKIGQLMLLADIEMYDPQTDTPMVANTTTIMENLGQVSYVFSDKTGTLTENLMRFRKMSVAGMAWLHDMDVIRDAQERVRRDWARGLVDRQESKGKGKHVGRTISTKRHAQVPSLETIETADEPLIERGRAGSNPQRSGFTPQWRSTVRPSQGQPELKTEDLLHYLRQKPHTTFSRKARQFILCIALCHTCLPEAKKNGDIEFQAASPDELALVEAARDLGYLLVDRPAQSIRLQFENPDGSWVTESYEVLDVIEFSSKRKRMSIIIRMPDGRVCVFTKGADSVILPRLKLQDLALRKASMIERRASKRKSVEQGKALQRKSSQATPRQSLNLARAASTISYRRSTGGIRSSLSRRRSASAHRRPDRQPDVLTDRVDTWLTRRETEDLDLPAVDAEVYQDPRQSPTKRHSLDLVMSPQGYDDDDLVDEALAVNEGAIFERCFQHIEDFASEGLRTLLFAYRYIEDEDYKKWKAIYHDATTSLVNRQDRIEAAAELIEQSFDLAGATAIEDKLQQGVPDTIDKLRRANIKVWMLTGDKRETAINIANSARICKPFSEIYILDSTEGNLQEKLASTLIEVGRGMLAHSVVVIDGGTLAVVEDDESLKALFFDLVARVDSVICCRASPSQKATLVKCIRKQVPDSLTLAIGDGANDISMIQASHVGIGISGREGLQAARIADFSIAQFRFLQRLLFVHGRWNYIRTVKYILGTFWKELLFYLVQALYQRYNGFTGTSLYESASLAVFNTLFTSLPVIILGIFEQDLHPKTLMALPELYSFGQKNKGFNFRLYISWMVMAVCESVLIFYIVYGMYTRMQFTDDPTLFAMGDMAFTVCVIFINIKMLVLELHHKTLVSFFGLVISVGGWFLWNIFLSAIYAKAPGPYIVNGQFINAFGRSWSWWLTVLAALSSVILLELAINSIRRVWWPRDQDLMQEVERYAGVMEIFKEHAAERGDAPGLVSMSTAVAAGTAPTTSDGGKIAGLSARGGEGYGYDEYEEGIYNDEATVRMPTAQTGGPNPKSEARAVTRRASMDQPRQQQQQIQQQKRHSRHLDEGYVLPAFTPLEEEEADEHANTRTGTV